MWSKLITVLIVAVTMQNVLGDDPACKSCDNIVDRVFARIGKALFELEPFSMDNVTVCKVVSMAGMNTIKRSGETCIAKGKGTTRHQKATIHVDEVRVNCTTIGLSELAKMLNIRFPTARMFPLIELPSLPWHIGSKKQEKKKQEKKKDPERLVIKAELSDLNLQLKMDLDFANDVFNVTDCTIFGNGYSKMSVWCDGSTIRSGLCSALPQIGAMRIALRAAIQDIARMAIGKVVQLPDLAEYIMLLNCGESDEE